VKAAYKIMGHAQTDYTRAGEKGKGKSLQTGTKRQVKNRRGRRYRKFEGCHEGERPHLEVKRAREIEGGEDGSPATQAL